MAIGVLKGLPPPRSDVFENLHSMEFPATGLFRLVATEVRCGGPKRFVAGHRFPGSEQGYRKFGDGSRATTFHRRGRGVDLRFETIVQGKLDFFAVRPAPDFRTAHRKSQWEIVGQWFAFFNPGLSRGASGPRSPSNTTSVLRIKFDDPPVSSAESFARFGQIGSIQCENQISDNALSNRSSRCPGCGADGFTGSARLPLESTGLAQAEVEFSGSAGGLALALRNRSLHELVPRRRGQLKWQGSDSSRSNRPPPNRGSGAHSALIDWQIGDESLGGLRSRYGERRRIILEGDGEILTRHGSEFARLPPRCVTTDVERMLVGVASD